MTIDELINNELRYEYSNKKLLNKTIINKRDGLQKRDVAARWAAFLCINRNALDLLKK